MNKFTFITLLLLTTFYSCKPEATDRPPVIEDKVDSYRVSYMHYGSIIMDTVAIQYNNGNIIKRRGGFLDILYSAWFTEDVYDTVTYSTNQVATVKCFNGTGVTFGPNERRFFLTGNKIEKCVIQNGSLTDLYTINYFYNNESIVRRVTYRNHLVSQADFYYNSNKNIDSIITRYSEYNPLTKEYEINPVDIRRDKEIFENYDTYSNPAKKLVIFEETFNRSLSVNNYRKYSKFKYDKFGATTSSQITNWTFVYENGKISFAK